MTTVFHQSIIALSVIKYMQIEKVYGLTIKDIIQICLQLNL